MAILFGAGAQAASAPKVTGISAQTSVYGRAIPIVFGQNRVAPNLIWYGDFASKGGSTSGKGGALAPGKGGSTQTTYSTAVVMALCEGAIVGIGNVYADKSVTT